MKERVGIRRCTADRVRNECVAGEFDEEGFIEESEEVTSETPIVQSYRKRM